MNHKQKHGLGIISEVLLDDNHLKDFSSAEINIDNGDVEITRKPFEKTLFEKKNELDNLHSKYCDYLTIKIPENYVSKKPIVIKKHLIGNSSNHTCIVVGKNSEVSIIVELSSKKLVSFTSEFVEVFAEENSKIDYSEINMIDNAVLYVKHKGIAKDNSSINWLTCDIGGIQVLSETITKLDGKFSSTKTNNVYFSSDNQKYNFYVEAEHNNENTKSNLQSKGIIKDSESFVRGLVKINENAQESNGYQKSDALLLDNSRIVSIPDLLIHNDKVKCSHGSTITRIDENKMFYMQSRGLSKRDAEIEIIKGFIEPEIKNTEIIPRFLSIVLEKINKVEANVKV